MLLVAARCYVHPDHCQTFTDQVARIIPLVLSEPGCTRYELHSDTFHDGQFIFCEEWESRKHLDDHLATPHMKEHFSKSAAWMTAPTELTVYEVTGKHTAVLS